MNDYECFSSDALVGISGNNSTRGVYTQTGPQNDEITELLSRLFDDAGYDTLRDDNLR